MPELPEVETTCASLAPLLRHATVTAVFYSGKNLRDTLSLDALQSQIGLTFATPKRRAKVLVFDLLGKTPQTMLVHLGMSGSLRIDAPGASAQKHDHVRWQLDTVQGKHTLVFNDPRRFGFVLPALAPIVSHAQCLSQKWLDKLGSEPIETTHLVSFAPRVTPQTWVQHARKSNQSIKSYLMHAKHLVGVGNIYACEALFRAGIHPEICGEQLSTKRLDSLLTQTQAILNQAITQGGSTIRDFSANHKPGYFAQQLNTYGRAGQPCHNCQEIIVRMVQNQRSTFYCPQCQARKK